MSRPSTSPDRPQGPDPFIGRDRELGVLGEFADSDEAELFVLYGRRRVGKTELLQRLCAQRRAVFVGRGVPLVANQAGLDQA